MNEIVLNDTLKKIKERENNGKFVTLSCKVHESDAISFISYANKCGAKSSKVLNTFVHEFINKFQSNKKKTYQIKNNINQNSYYQKGDKTDFSRIKRNISLEILAELKREKIIHDYFFDDDIIFINGDCLKTMEGLISKDVVVDHVLTDIPYGTVQGLSIEGWKNKGNIPDWDMAIDPMKMLSCCFNITKSNSNLLLFTQEPMTNTLINKINEFKKYSLSNKLIWLKNNHANAFNAKTTPVNIYEEIVLFRKVLDESNSLVLREYFKKILDNISDDKKQIMNKLGQGLDHCFRYSNRTFYIPTEKNYNALIREYKIDKLPFFLPYYKMKKIWDSENTPVFNLPNNSKIIRNVLEFKKDLENIHPTQKPLELLKYLIKIFTNKNDWVLDFTSGSGSCGIACLKEKRKFIGIELDEEFYRKSVEWYKREKNLV